MQNVDDVSKQMIDSLFEINLQLSSALTEAMKFLPPHASACVAKAMQECK